MYMHTDDMTLDFAESSSQAFIRVPLQRYGTEDSSNLNSFG